MKRVHVWISGRVQGVFFRASTRKTARRLGLSGWVRNLSDGRVEALAEGPESEVNRWLEWCRSGPPVARVEEVETVWEEVQGDLEGFDLRID
ncbi:MAG: acylphosphatase [Planctomycetota bacterium]|jgi:acylphosphatase|nr:acylphosphatase [Planctomycetota bacterium]